MKAALPRRARAIASILVMALAGCDSYSLLDQFVLPDKAVPGGGGPTEPLSLAADGDSAERLSGTVGLTPSGGLQPYSYSVAGVALAGKTSALGKGTVSDNVYYAGGAIGQIRITVTDAAGSSAFALIAVLPPAPTLSVSRIGGGSNASVAWTHAAPDVVDTFVIERQASDETVFKPWYSSPTTGSSNDNSLDPAKQYKYRILARSGTFDSAWFETTI